MLALKQKAWLFPSWSITYLLLWNNKLLDINAKFWKDNLTLCRITASIFYHHFCIKVEWNFFTSFSKKRAKFKMSDLPLKMSSKALNYVSWKCFFKSSFCLNVVPHCEQAYCFQPLWSNTCCVLALKQKVYSFSHHGALPILCSETTSYLICM